MSKRWASDEVADDLLAGILNDTAAEAESEEKRIAAEIESRREQAARETAEAEAQRLKLAEARLAAERKRQEEIRERRTQKMKALEPVQEKPERPRDVVSPERPSQPHEPEPRKPAPSTPVPTAIIAPVSRRSAPRSLAVAVVIAAVLGSIVAVAGPGSYEVDRQQYVKSVYAPKDRSQALVEKGYELVPAAEEARPEKVEDRPRAAGPRVKDVEKPATLGKEASEKASRLEQVLEGSADPFGMGP